METDVDRAFDLLDAGLAVPELSRLILELGIRCRFVDGKGVVEMTEAQLMQLATELVWKGRERQAFR